MEVELSGASARHLAARHAKERALQNISLRVQPGEQVAVIGPSGAGKTTLLALAGAALKPVSGLVRLDGQDPWQVRPAALKALRGRLILAPQVPPLPPRQRVVTAVLAAQLPAMSLARSLRSLLYPVDIAGAHAALDRFDMADKLFERVDRLSGGERQRVALSRALVAPASLWLIDEPLSALDPTRARQAMATLVDEAGERGATLLVTLHQVEVALERFARIVGLRNGELVFDLPTAQVTPALLAQLYAQHEDELHGAPAPPLSAPGELLPVVMHCR